MDMDADLREVIACPACSGPLQTVQAATRAWSVEGVAELVVTHASPRSDPTSFTG